MSKATDGTRDSWERPPRSGGEQVLRDAIHRLESYARGMWRYRRRALVALWTFSILGWVVVYSLPPVFQANARIYVDTETAIRPLLQGIASSSNVLNEVTVVSREMLSRPNLAEVARSTDLDLRASDPGEFEDLLTELGERIQVTGSRDNIFTIAYQDPDRDKAVAVVGALVDTFVEKSLGAERSDANQAQSFLQAQISEYEERLTSAEDQLATFKRENVAFMPDQQGDYFERLQKAESERNGARDQLKLAERRREELLRQIEGEEPVFGIMASGQSDGGNAYNQAKIRELEGELKQMRLQFTDKHPRIQQILQTIEFLKTEEDTAGPSPGALDNQKPLEMNPVYQNMRIQLSNTDVEIANLRAKLQQQERQVRELQQAVDTVPQVEADLGRLNRDYDVIKVKYEQLLEQLETANIGENVEASIDDVQFRIIDPPFSDLDPAGPKRQLLMSAVLVLSMGVGVVLAFIMDQLHPVLFSARDVTTEFGLPVLGTVNMLLTRQQVKKKRGEKARFILALLVLLAVFGVAVALSGPLSNFARTFAGLDV